MRKILVSVAVLVCLIAAGIPASAGPDMKEGDWEITMTMEMAGMPMKMPPFTHVVCMNKDNMVPQDPNQPGDCENVEPRIDGDTVSWKVKCKNESGGNVESHDSITYHGDTFEGVVETTVMEPGQGGMHMTNTMKGRYLGPCSQ